MCTLQFLVPPYMEHGTLPHGRIKVNPSVAEIEECVRFLFLQLLRKLSLSKILEVAQGIKSIHSRGVVHGDLQYFTPKLSILKHQRCSPGHWQHPPGSRISLQIADFGSTRLSQATQSGTLHFNFTVPSSPELPSRPS